MEESFGVSLFSGIEKIYAQEGYITIFHRKFLSHCAENICGGTLLFFQKMGFREILRIIVGYHDFPSKTFSLTVPKNLVRQSFSVSLISGIERFYAQEVYVTIFH